MRLSINRLIDLINSKGIHTFYNHTTKEDIVTLPFCVVLDNGSENTMADNKVYAKAEHLLIILHTYPTTINNLNDISIEEKLESLFDECCIPWEKEEVEWLSDEMFYQTPYKIWI